MDKNNNLKNRERQHYYSFANINLLGKCNADCYFCLGKDIAEHLNKHDQRKTHFTAWKNFDKFLDICTANYIPYLYITGQNTDSLQYLYLEELIDYLQQHHGFNVGIRTNGKFATHHLPTLNKCKRSVGYSIHTLNNDTAVKIMGWPTIPDWNTLLMETKHSRVSIVVNRYNVNEIFDLIKYISLFNKVSYIQIRRVSTDTRYDELAQDIRVYEELFQEVLKRDYKRLPDFYGAERFIICNKEVCFWRTVKTSINSINYFTDGTWSSEYFVVEGYLKNNELLKETV